MFPSLSPPLEGDVFMVTRAIQLFNPFNLGSSFFDFGASFIYRDVS